MKTDHKTVAALVAAIVLLALGIITLLWFFGQIETEAGMRRQNVAVLNEANELLSAMKDAETGQRGYLLTGDEVFLQPYVAVRGSINSHVQSLHHHEMNSAARQHLDALTPLIDAKLAELSRLIDLRRHQDMAGVYAGIRSGKGKRLMDSIRHEMHELIRTEETALAQRDAELATNMRYLFAIIISTGLLILLFASLFAYFFYQKIRQQINSLVHLETQRLLGIQETMNKKLQVTNRTLRISEENLAVTLRSIGDAVITTDAESRVTFLNPVAEQLTGWTQTQASGLPVHEIFHIINKTSRQQVTIPIVDALAHGTIQGLVNHTVLICRDGSEYDIADSCAPIRDRDGKVTGAVLVFRDVTREYAVAQALHDSSALIQTVLNTVADGIITALLRRSIRRRSACLAMQPPILSEKKSAP